MIEDYRYRFAALGWSLAVEDEGEVAGPGGVMQIHHCLATRPGTDALEAMVETPAAGDREGALRAALDDLLARAGEVR